MSTRTCEVELLGRYTGTEEGTTALAALPDGRLASRSNKTCIVVWDVRPAAASGTSMPTQYISMHPPCYEAELVVLPDGRLLPQAVRLRQA